MSRRIERALVPVVPRQEYNDPRDGPLEWAREVARELPFSLLFLDPHFSPVASLISQIRGEGWGVVRINLVDCRSERDVQTAVVRAIKPPAAWGINWHAIDDWMTELPDLKKKDKICLVVDARCDASVIVKSKLARAILLNLQHMRGTYLHTFPMGGLCKSVLGAIWLDSPEQRLPLRAGEELVVRTVPLVPMRPQRPMMRKGALQALGQLDRAEVIAGIERGLADKQAGRTRSAREAVRELRVKFVRRRSS